MCTLSSIKLLVMVMSWFKLIITVYVFYVGIYFAGSTDLQQAFGVEFQSYGLSLIFLALLSGIIILPHKFGVDRHNRFIMVVTFVFDTIVFAELISFGLTVQSYTYPKFDKFLQLDCLRNTPKWHTYEECLPFYNSDRTAGFRLMWEGYFSDKSDKTKFQVLSTIQGGLCCGFFSPFKCQPNTSKFPKNRLTKGVSSAFLKGRVTCGDFPDYYPRQSNCISYEDYSANPPLIGGCYYDLGVSFCLDVAIGESSTGCASAVEDYVVSLIAPHAVMLMASSTLNAIFMLFACCMWWKRKETDIFPEFITEHKVPSLLVADFLCSHVLVVSDLGAVRKCPGPVCGGAEEGLAAEGGFPAPAGAVRRPQPARRGEQGAGRGGGDDSAETRDR